MNSEREVWKPCVFRVGFCAQWILRAEMVLLNRVACVGAGESPFVVPRRCGSAAAASLLREGPYLGP